MKRIISIILLIFISSLILNNFFAGLKPINSHTNIVSKKISEDTSKIDQVKEKDTLKLVDLKVDSLKSETLKLSKPKNSKLHLATWYHTKGTIVHREYPTAAYNFAPRGSKLRVINTLNSDTIIVEVTDRMGRNSKNHIDLSHMAFGQISKHGYGKIPVIVEIID
jgi:rare lipoprotein A (peptidoglycan hydrolase)